MSIKTQLTELFLANTDTGSSAATVVKFHCPTAITGLGGPADQIDTTCLDDTERTFKQGLANPGQVSVPFNFEPSEVSHQILYDLKEQGNNLNWIICFSDGNDVPTLNSINEFNAPVDRTSAKFVAYIADVNIDVGINEIVRGTLTLQRSGPVEWNFLA